MFVCYQWECLGQHFDQLTAPQSFESKIWFFKDKRGFGFDLHKEKLKNMNGQFNVNSEIQKIQDRILIHLQVHWKVFEAEGVFFITLGTNSHYYS